MMLAGAYDTAEYDNAAFDASGEVGEITLYNINNRQMDLSNAVMGHTDEMGVAHLRLGEGGPSHTVETTTRKENEMTYEKWRTEVIQNAAAQDVTDGAISPSDSEYRIETSLQSPPRAGAGMNGASFEEYRVDSGMDNRRPMSGAVPTPFSSAAIGGAAAGFDLPGVHQGPSHSGPPSVMVTGATREYYMGSPTPAGPSSVIGSGGSAISGERFVLEATIPKEPKVRASASQENLNDFVPAQTPARGTPQRHQEILLETTVPSPMASPPAEYYGTGTSYGGSDFHVQTTRSPRNQSQILLETTVPAPGQPTVRPSTGVSTTSYIGEVSLDVTGLPQAHNSMQYNQQMQGMRQMRYEEEFVVDATGALLHSPSGREEIIPVSRISTQ